MNILIVIIALIIAKGKDLTCQLSTCPDIIVILTQKGNNKCDSECMTSYCNFDSLLSTDGKVNKESSDCYESCVNFDGCDPALLGDGKCDSSCNTEKCGFDWGDCTCAPECLDSMLGDGKCDEACDNWDCDLDNHYCGQCADGCFPTMFGNGVCDIECNNEDCLYDYKDCQCADGCLAVEYGNCKPECMVLSCNYDKVTQYPNNWCQNSSLAIFSSYQQMIRDDFSYAVHLEDCYKASNYSCTLEKALNFSNCYEECNFLECNFANGNCIYDPDSSLICTRYYNLSDDLCLNCSHDVLSFTVWSDRGNCIQDYSSSIILPDGSNAIISFNDTSSLSNPHVYFARSDRNSDFSSGNGTYFSPFANLMNALYRLAYRYSILYLLEGDDYYLTLTSLDTFSYPPGYLLEGLAEKHIKITTLNNSIVTIRRAKDDNNSWNQVAFSFALTYIPTIEMSNIIFNWQDTLSSCNSSSYCEYCPYVEFDWDSNSYYNDRGEPIIDFLPSVWCEEEKYVIFFKLERTNLVLKNVNFVNFRTGFYTLFDLNDSSNLTLLNVTFDNIKVYNSEISSSIIKARDVLSNSGNIYFEDGFVSRINNGYELEDPINTRGFLYAENVSSIILKNVEFRNNIVFKNTLTGNNMASLLTLISFQALTIDSCNFTYNYCDLGLINVQMEDIDFSEEMDDMGVIVYSKINHIYIKNSKFVSNYGKQAGILSAIYEFDIQNLLIENCLFALNGILSGPLVYFEGPSDNENNINDRNITVALDDGSITEAKFLAKWWKIYNSSFIENYSGSNGIIEINKIVNIEWKDVNMTSNGGYPNENMNMNSVFTKYYISDPSIYAKMEISDPPDLNCNSLSLVSNSLYFHIELLNIDENYCRYSSPSIALSNSTNIIINSSYFIGNYGTGISGICLDFDDKCTLTIENSEFNSNQNYNSGSSGTISSYSNLLLKTCLFSNNIGPLYFAGQNLTIISSIFNSNNSTGSYGGSIHFSVLADKIKDLLFFISNTIFENNFCSAHGGAIFIDKRTSINLILSIIAENTTFYNNKASYGSCIYIDENVQLSTNSLIKDCQFLDNKASSSGAIVASYAYGVITFDNCVFSGNIATRSSAIVITIGENDNLNPSKIVLYSCYFQLNRGNSTISLGNSKRNSTLEVSDCTFEYNIGSTFALNSGYVLDKNSNFQHNYSPISGGSINLKNSAIFQSQNAMHLNCSSNLNGGVASISLGSQYFCFLCIFNNNYADSSGGAIYADSDASFFIKETEISGNSCKNKGSAIFIASSSANSTIVESEIYSNYAYNDGAIFILSSLLSIFSSKIYHNSAQGENPGLYADDSEIELNDVAFTFQNGNQGCFILLSASYAMINNTIFSDGYSNSSGTAIHATSSNIEIISSTFSSLYSNETGGAIYFYESSSLTIKSSLIINLTSSIDSYLSSIFIEDSIFSNCASTSIFGTKLAELSISFSEFFNNVGTNGGAIACLQCNNISIASSSFSNNFAENGGAIYIEKQGDGLDFSTCSIIYSTFQSNMAGNGGAIWTNNINLDISFSNFTENYVNSSQTESLLEIKDGIGGAIKIAYDDYQESYYINISSNNFNNNRASYRGGAISWENSYPILQDNIFQNNSAFYGDNIALFPAMLTFLNNNYGRSMEGQILSTNKESLILNSIASGQKNNPPLTFALVDSFYQIITTDISSQAQLLAIDNETVISGTAVAYASNGIYVFDDYAISAKPGSSLQVYIVSSAIDESKAEKMQVSPNFYINITMRLCEIGEAAVGLNCEVCPEFYYNIDSFSSKCSDCPSSAICYGNYTIVPKPGYWRNDKFTDIFWKCPHSSSCLGSPDSSNISFVGYCKKGYEDNMCSSCEKGYARLFKYECQKCPDMISSIFRWLGIFLLLCFVAIVLHKTTRQFLFEPRLFLSIYIKIFWNYLQFMIIIATFNLDWPEEITQFFYIESCIDYINAQLFSFDCFVQSSCYSKYQKYFYKVLLASLTPIYLGILSLFFWIVIYKIQKKYLKDIKDDYISSFIVLLYLILPSIANVMFNTMSCREINHKEFWLNEDLGIRCWDNKHLYLAFLLALPTIIVWVIAVPYFCLLKLRKKKKYCRERWMKLRYGFLYSEYESKYYYWEFIMFYCKVILISCSAFLANISLSIQTLITLLFIALLYHIHNKNKPLISHHLNQVEAFAMSSWLLTFLSGLLYITNNLNSYISAFIAILVLIINSYFILYIAYKLLLMTSIMNYLIKLVARIFHLKSKYAMKESSNNSEEMIRDYKILPIRDEKLSTSINFLNYTKNFQNIISAENGSISLEIDPLASEKSFPDN